MSDAEKTDRPPYIVLPWTDDEWCAATIMPPRSHPYGTLAWQEEAPNGEWRIYRDIHAAASDGMPAARSQLQTCAAWPIERSRTIEDQFKRAAAKRIAARKETK